MSKDTEVLQSALATVNATGKMVTDAMNKLTEHNTDVEAHDDIRQILKRLLESENIYTNDEIVELIRQALEVHSSQSFKDAHTGYAEFAGELENRFQNIAAEIAALDTRLKAIEEGNDPDAGTPTELRTLINQVNAKYEPRITSLTELIQQATAQGDEDLAQSYQDALKTTLENRNKEIAQVTADWVASQSGAPKE